MAALPVLFRRRHILSWRLPKGVWPVVKRPKTHVPFLFSFPPSAHPPPTVLMTFLQCHCPHSPRLHCTLGAPVLTLAADAAGGGGWRGDGVDGGHRARRPETLLLATRPLLQDLDDRVLLQQLGMESPDPAEETRGTHACQSVRACCLSS